MRVELDTFMILVVALIAFNCKTSIDDSRQPPPNPTQLDTLEREVSPGVMMRLSGLRESYGLGDTLSGKITLTNVSDTNRFKVIFPIWPAWRLYVYDDSSTFVGGGPDVVSFSEVRYELAKGDSNLYEVYWSMNTFFKGKGGIEFPAVAGKYRLSFKLDGNSSFTDKPLTKWISTTANDSQPLLLFQTTYRQTDRSILDFALRNRTLTDFVYHFDGEPVASFTMIDSPGDRDTLFRDTLSFQSTEFLIRARSDTLLFTYRPVKTQPLVPTLRGAYEMYVNLKFREQVIQRSTLVLY